MTEIAPWQRHLAIDSRYESKARARGEFEQAVYSPMAHASKIRGHEDFHNTRDGVIIDLVAGCTLLSDDGCHAHVRSLKATNERAQAIWTYCVLLV